MRAETLRRFLAEHGPATWDEICAATGLSEHQAMIEVKRLEYHPADCIIRYEHRTVVSLLHDPEHPVDRTCAEPGCGEHLSKSNPHPYCRFHVECHAQMVMEALCDLWPSERDPYEGLKEVMCGE